MTTTTCQGLGTWMQDRSGIAAHLALFFYFIFFYMFLSFFPFFSFWETLIWMGIRDILIPHRRAGSGILE